MILFWFGGRTKEKYLNDRHPLIQVNPRYRNAEVFAGYSTKKPLNEVVADGLSREFGVDPSKWQHAKGIGTLDYHGEEIKAEVHWLQEESIGKVKFKVKDWKE